MWRTYHLKSKCCGASLEMLAINFIMVKWLEQASSRVFRVLINITEENDSGDADRGNC